jgi:glycosyltransferase involved in cell wall biosynthesis
MPHCASTAARTPVQGGALHVLHVLPRDLARGAQVYARALADHANRVAGEHHEVAVLFAGDRVAALADHELAVPPGRLLAAGMDPRAAWRLRRLVLDRQPDVVIAHGAESLKYAAFARSTACSLVCHAIGVAAPKARRGPHRVLHRWLLARADLVTAVSDAVADELRWVFRLPGDRVRVVPNGRDPAVFTPSRTGDRDGPPRLVFVGHLTVGKRPEVFLDVVGRLRARGSSFEALMVGDGPLASSVRRVASAAEVRVVGRSDDVASLLRSADVLLFTSAPEGEGLPGVFIEASLAGVPVVATEVPGARDVIQDGHTGRILPVDDLSGLTDAVEQLLGNPDLRTTMGRAARARCEQLYSMERSTGIFLTELAAVAERRQRSHARARRGVAAVSARTGRRRQDGGDGSAREQQNDGED